MKTIIMDHINKYSDKNQATLMRWNHTVEISKVLNLSRSTTSQYLNELLEDGALCKVNTRPVIFFNKEILGHKNNLSVDKSIYHSFEELFSCHTRSNPFEKCIGYNGSLLSIVKQCKSALAYPKGLPILLSGESGCGKSFIASTLYETALQDGFLTNNHFVHFNCSDYASNPELLSIALFGAKKGAYTDATEDTLGIVEAANGGILFLDEIHALPPSSQEKLFLLIDQGTYHKFGDNQNIHHVNLKFIFATTMEPQDCLLPTLLRRIPITVKIPSLQERPITEKEAIINQIISVESKHLKRQISLNKTSELLLLKTKFKGNIGHLKNELKVAIARASYDQEGDKIEIYPKYLDKNILKNMNEITLPMINNNNSKVFLQVMSELENQEIDFVINKYYDKFIFELPIKLDDYEIKLLDRIFSIIMNRHHFQISNQSIVTAAKIIKSLQHSTLSKKMEEKIEITYQKKVKDDKGMDTFLKDLIHNVNINLDIQMNTISKYLIWHELTNCRKEKKSKNYLAIVLCHGYSTASSIARTCNSLLEDDIFEAIDLELDMSIEKVIQKLHHYLELSEKVKDIYLLVDMGSLSTIHKSIVNMKHHNMIIVDQVSTPIALSLGNMIVNQIPLREIALKLSLSKPSALYIPAITKPKAIVVCFKEDEHSATKLAALLKKSCSDMFPMQILACDEKQFYEWGIINDYDIKVVVVNEKMLTIDIPQLYVEDLVVGTEKIEEVFGNLLEESELNNFINALVEDFTLQNIINHLSILNPTKVLDDAIQIVSTLEKITGLKVSNLQRVGIYMHICSLMERLITRSTVSYYQNIDEFSTTHNLFVTAVKESFREIEIRYSVEISVEEIAYLYNYMIR